MISEKMIDKAVMVQLIPVDIINHRYKGAKHSHCLRIV